jgi:dipeptidase D
VIGCQGACRWTAAYENPVEKIPRRSLILDAEVTGFAGGHSGLNIHENRGNVARLIAEFLLTTGKRLPSLQLLRVDAGDDGVFNKIPSAARVQLAVSDADFPFFRALFKRQIAAWQKEFGRPGGVPQGNLKFNVVKSTKWAITREDLFKGLQIFLMVRDGPVLKGPGLPNDWNLTSNQAYLVIRSGPKGAATRFGVMSRAYDDDALKLFVQSSVAQARQFADKREIKIVHEFPAWTPDPDSPLIPLVTEAMKKNGVSLKYIGAVAGGLETAAFASRYPKIPMISIGPSISDVHSPAERFSISSVEKFVGILDDVLSSIGDFQFK